MLTLARQFLRDQRHTGAIMPSSPRLARAMTLAVRSGPHPKRVLEVGPGTGPFTRPLLEALEPGDSFDIVEINADLADWLDSRLLQPYRDSHEGVAVRLVRGPIETVDIEPGYDHIVCGLPFNNFPPALVRSIFRRLLDLLAPGGELNYFEYAGVRAMKGTVVGIEGRRKLKRIGATGKILSRRHGGRRKLVLGNVPPAFAVRLVR